MAAKQGMPRLTALVLVLVAPCVALLVAAHAVPLPARLTLPGSSRMLWADGGIAHARLAPDDRWRIPADLERIDPEYVTALLAYEDARFRSHPGVDPVSVARAAWQNMVAGRVVSGASTLTMQLVRLAEPRPRTLRSKVIEAVRALQLEVRLDKDEILEAYLSLAPYGGNLEGVETAAWAYFGHDATALSASEICVLLAVPQDPAARAPRPGAEAALRAARDHVAKRLAAVGALPVGEGAARASVDTILQTVRDTSVPVEARALPRAAPHAAAWLARQPLGLGGGRAVATTLDRGAQALVERTVAAHAPRLARSGIDDVAVVVADWTRGDIRALVGGTDFWSVRPGAQIPSFAVPRSPGSTLKPLLYAAAIDEGRVLPGFLVPDIPIRRGAYAPTNYDGQFDGMVRLEGALSRSLNVPFVELLGDVGVPSFLHRLRALGVESLDPRPGHYGLSLIVGGAELTPLDIATAYAGLAADGRARPLRWRADAPVPDPEEVFSPGAAWLTRRALRLKDRPDFPARRELSAMPRGLHWKTGTSFGHRDAWAVGSGARFTVAVWLGNLDQRPSRRLVGSTAAGPLLFDVLEGLNDGLAQVPLSPADLMPVAVCSLSGRVADDHCPHTREVLALETAVPPGRCDLHQSVQVDARTGLRVRAGCREQRDVSSQVVVRWPARVRRWLSDHHLGQPASPSWADGCAPVAVGAAPRIVSPAAGAVALLIPGLPLDEQEVPLEAEASEGPLNWFVDGSRVGVAPPDGRVWWRPSEGRHEVMVMDPAGRSTRVWLDVREG